MISTDRVKEALHYDPESGIFTWRIDWRGGRNSAFVRFRQGERAGFLSGGYRYISLDGFRRAEHQFAWLCMTGTWPTGDIDHINGRRDDNRWANLRETSRSINMQNLKGPHRDSSTGFLGVEKKRDRFAARICINGKKRSLGVFDTPELAHAAYLKAKRAIHKGNTL